MLTILWIILGVAAYMVFAVALARCMGMNNYGRARETHTMLKRWNRRIGPRDRRKRKAPIVAERRRGPDRRRWARQRGATMVFVTILMATVIMPFMALALGYGNAHVAKTEIQMVADAVALGTVVDLYGIEPRPEFCTPGDANNTGKALITANGYALNDCTVELGHWNAMTATFTPGALGNIPDWETVDMDTMWADTFFTNAASVRCTTTAEIFFAGFTVEPVAVAVAVKRMKASDGGGVELVRGSALAK